MKYVVLLLVLRPLMALTQEKILFVGNTDNICIDSILPFADTSSALPKEIDHYEVIFIFSNARSVLTTHDQNQLLNFLSMGKGLYLGSENWPLQAESNQVTETLYEKKVWGNFETTVATADSKGLLKELKSFPAGNTTVAFPMDYRLNVDAWINDEPLILSGLVKGGRLIIDGGYSRFYCNWDHVLNREIMRYFIDFLKRP